MGGKPLFDQPGLQFEQKNEVSIRTTVRPMLAADAAARPAEAVGHPNGDMRDRDLPAGGEETEDEKEEAACDRIRHDRRKDER